jgi:hypothetical protein
LVALASSAIFACALRCSSSASICFNSASRSVSWRWSAVPSNATARSPAFTFVPFLTSFTICRSPACIGAVRTTDLTGRISLRSSTTSTNSPRVTTAVGTFARVRPTPPKYTTSTTATITATADSGRHRETNRTASALMSLTSRRAAREDVALSHT